MEESCFLIALNFNCTGLLIIVCFWAMVGSSARLHVPGLEGILWLQFSPSTLMWVLRMKRSSSGLSIKCFICCVITMAPFTKRKKNQRENGDNLFMCLLVTWEERDQTMHLSLVRMSLFTTLTEYCFCQQFLLFLLCQISQTVWAQLNESTGSVQSRCWPPSLKCCSQWTKYLVSYHSHLTFSKYKQK